MRNKYTQEHYDFIKENVVNTEKKLVEMFNNKFDIKISISILGNLKSKLHIKSGLIGGQFEKGNIPHNKNKKINEYMSKNSIIKISQTWFKKDNHNFNNADHNKRKVFEERITKDGYIEIKIEEPNKWEYKHRYIYKKFIGEIPKDYIVSFADGDKTNFNLDNLILMKRSENLIMNNKGLYYKNKYLTKSGYLISKILDKKI